MAIDKDTTDKYDPIVAALEARLAALEAGGVGVGEPPEEHIMKWKDGKVEIYKRVVVEP